MIKVFKLDKNNNQNNLYSYSLKFKRNIENIFFNI